MGTSNNFSENITGKTRRLCNYKYFKLLKIYCINKIHSEFFLMRGFCEHE